MSAAPFVAETLAALALETWPTELHKHGALERDYVSASQLKMFARCPEQFRRHYVLGENERPSKALVWGSADHMAHEVNFKQKVFTQENISTPDIQVAFAEAVDKKVEENGGVGEVEWERDTTLTGDDAKKAAAAVKDAGVRLVTHYHERVSPAILPSACEEEFIIPGPELGLPVSIKGYIDLQGRTPDHVGSFNYVERIIERKTAASRKKPGPEYIFQSRVYQLVKPLEVDIQFSVKTKTPSVVAFEHIQPVLPQPMLLAQVQRVMVGVAHAYSLYGPDEPWPGVFAGFADTCGYCGFKDTCPWWRPDMWPAGGKTKSESVHT